MADRIESANQLRSLAFLYLAMGHGTDNYLSGAELEAITDRLHARYPGHDRAAVQDVVGEAMAVYMESEDVVDTATELIVALKDSLSEEQRRAVLRDVLAVAEADGVVLQNERGLLTTLAASWGMDLEGGEALGVSAVEDLGRSGWSVLHHLALIYLVLAHGTDSELSDSERSVMLRQLREWAPKRSEDEMRAILSTALEQYGRGVSEEQFADSVYAVREGMPESMRMAALNDLVKIANADGVFLDREEDLINQLLAAWQVRPYASYGRHGSKE
ncbi:MAG TPA: TerB family tellurite resistance protein [Rhodothermales bacterium]|nr:TerB family tellurite resistance protein [Rhodothermales bacterium]